MKYFILLTLISSIGFAAERPLRLNMALSTPGYYSKVRTLNASKVARDLSDDKLKVEIKLDQDERWHGIDDDENEPNPTHFRKVPVEVYLTSITFSQGYPNATIKKQLIFSKEKYPQIADQDSNSHECAAANLCRGMAWLFNNANHPSHEISAQCLTDSGHAFCADRILDLTIKP